MAIPSAAAMPIIASSDRGLDIIPYCHYLFSQELDKFIAIFPCEFPQGDRNTEEGFLRRFFNDNEIQVQGGAEGDGSGFRFLKDAWLWAAHWNLNCRVPALAAWWIKHNQSILNDPDIKKRIFEPHVQPGTLFESKEISIYGDKLLRVVVKRIQYHLQHQAPNPAHGRPPAVGAAGLDDAVSKGMSESTESSHPDAEGNILQQMGKFTKGQQNTEETAAKDSRVEGVPAQGQGQTQLQQRHPRLEGNTQQDNSGDAANAVVNHRGGQTARGSHGHGSPRRGAQAGNKPIYGRQDARYHLSLLSFQPCESQSGATPTAGTSIRPITLSASSYAVGQGAYTPPIHSSPQFAGQAPPMQSLNGLPTPCGYPVQGNFQAQFHHPVSDQPSFPLGFAPHHVQPFGDRSNFPIDGRSFANESRLYDPEEKTKHTKQGSNSTQLRKHKHRGQSHSQRGGNRGHHIFGPSGRNFARDGHNFHRHASSEFYGSAGYGQVLNNQGFSIPPRDKYWQLPYLVDNNTLSAQNYEQAPHVNNNPLHPSISTGSGMPHNPDDTFISSHQAQYSSIGHSSGHQRGLSKSLPCAPTECNKYSIGEDCTYARKLIIFQVPLNMTATAFEGFFRSFGAVETFCLSENYDDSQNYTGSLQRRMSWVLFAHANSARAVLERRGKPWDGGSTLFAEVAGEYWDPEVRLTQPYRKAYGHSVSLKSRATNTIDDSPGMDNPSSDVNLTAPGHDTQKEKSSNNSNNNNNNTKKSRKYKKSAPDNEIGAEPKKSAIQQNLQPGCAPSRNDFPHPSPGWDNSVATKPTCERQKTQSAVKPAIVGGEPLVQVVERTIDCKKTVKAGGPENVIKPKTSQSVKSSSSVTAEIATSPPLTVKELEATSLAVADNVNLLNGTDEAIVMLLGDQADDSFHTTDGSHGEYRDVTTSEMCITAWVARAVPSSLEDCLESSSEKPGTDTEDVANVIESTKITDSPSIEPAFPVDSLASNPDSCEELAKQGQSTTDVEDSSIDEIAAATDVRRPVTIALTAIDTRIVTVEDNNGNDGTAHSAQLRVASAGSASGVPTSAFVTAPSTPAIPAPDMQIKSKKALKCKGPAQTESLSLFAKPKSRKSSSKKTKPIMEPRNRLGSVSTAALSGQVVQSQLPEPTAIVVASNVATEPNAAKDDDFGASSASSQELTSAKTWSVSNTVEPVRAFLSMASAPPDMKSDGSVSSVDHLPHVPVEEEISSVQPVKPAEDDTSPDGFEDTQTLSAVDLAAGLGIFEPAAISSTAIERTPSPDADESKPKKKKMKPKAKNKNSKASADVTIIGNDLIHPKPNEPIYEFKGNDATSDSSSQTLGRTSPAGKRPSLRQIDEAKQPKSLLESRPARQIRSKKHSIVHSSKTDGTDSAEDNVVDTIDTPSNRTIILTPWGDGTYLQGELEGKKGTPLEQYALMPTATPMPEALKSSPTPEMPWDTMQIAEVETPSTEAAKSREKLRLIDLEAARKKKKFA